MLMHTAVGILLCPECIYGHPTKAKSFQQVVQK